jgi:hypothetical protein
MTTSETRAAAENSARSWLYGCMGYLKITVLPDEAVQYVVDRLLAEWPSVAALATPSVASSQDDDPPPQCAFCNEFSPKHLPGCPGMAGVQASAAPVGEPGRTYKCDDCGCIFEARLLRSRQNKTTTPHLEAWMGPINNCCHCGGTLIAEWNPLTKKEAKILDAMLEAKRAKPAAAPPAQGATTPADMLKVNRVSSEKITEFMKDNPAPPCPSAAQGAPGTREAQITAEQIIKFDRKTGSTHMTDREQWGELMVEQINAALAQPGAPTKEG